MISDLMDESGTYTTREQVEEAYGKDNINDYILDRKAEDIIFNSAVAK